MWSSWLRGKGRGALGRGASRNISLFCVLALLASILWLLMSSGIFKVNCCLEKRFIHHQGDLWVQRGSLHEHLGDFADAFTQSDSQRFKHSFTHRRVCEVHHARRQLTRREQSGWGPLLRDISTLSLEEPGIKLETFRSQINPLYLLSWADPSTASVESTVYSAGGLRWVKGEWCSPVPLLCCYSFPAKQLYRTERCAFIHKKICVITYFAIWVYALVFSCFATAQRGM